MVKIELNYDMHEKGFKTTTDFGELVISGQDQFGFRPYFLLVSSVVGCSGGRLRKELDALGLTYKDIKVKADVTRNPDEANRVEKIHLTFTVQSKDMPMEKLEEAMRLTYEKSAMLQTVKGCVQVSDTLQIV